MSPRTKLVCSEESSFIRNFTVTDLPLTPVWFVHVQDAFWVSSGERNVKVRNVLNDPRVSLALADA